MRLTLKLATLGMVLAFGMTACSDDSGTTPTPDNGMKKEAGTPDMTPTEGGMTPDTTPTEAGTGDMAATTGKCDNATDKANVGKDYGGKDLTTLIAEQAGCLIDPNPKKCLVDAVKVTTGTDISEDCLGCFADSALCTAQHCLAECVTGGQPSDPACIACRCGTNTASVNCVKTYEDCSGLTSSVTCN